MENEKQTKHINKKQKNSIYHTVFTFADQETRASFSGNKATFITNPTVEILDEFKKIKETSILTIIDNNEEKFWEMFFQKYPKLLQLVEICVVNLNIKWITKIFNQSDNIKTISIQSQNKEEDKQVIKLYDKWNSFNLGKKLNNYTELKIFMSFYDAKIKGFDIWKRKVIPTIYFLNSKKGIKMKVYEKVVTRNGKDITKLFSYCKFNETFWIYWILKKHFYIPKEIIHIILDNHIWLFVPTSNKKKILEKTWFPLSYFKK